MKNRIFLLYGNTCSGKCTLGMKLEEYGFHYISFGDLKRQAIANRTNVGKKLREQIEKGKAINPKIGAELITRFLLCGTNIISGFPISEEELAAFRRTLQLRSFSILGIIELQIEKERIFERFFNRKVCPICSFPGGEDDDICPKHRIMLIKRIDCNNQELVSRLKLYTNRIEPFLRSGKLKDYHWLQIDVTELSKIQVFKETRAFILNT